MSTSAAKEPESAVFARPIDFDENLGAEAMIPVSALIVERYEDKPDSFYQRGLTAIHMQIIEHWNAKLFGRLIIVALGKGKYAVVDGQNRLHAAIVLGMTHVACVVHKNMNIKERAQMFWELNTATRTLRPIDRFRAALAAGNEAAIEIKKILDSFGITVASGSSGVSTLAAITTVFDIYNVGGAELVTRTLAVITNAWPDDRHRYQNAVLGGVSYFIDHDHEISDDNLTARLASLSVNDVIRQGTDLHTRGGHGGHSHVYVARGIAIIMHGAKAKRNWPNA